MKTAEIRHLAKVERCSVDEIAYLSGLKPGRVRWLLQPSANFVVRRNPGAITLGWTRMTVGARRLHLLNQVPAASQGPLRGCL